MGEQHRVFIQMASGDTAERNGQITNASAAINRVIFNDLGVMVKSIVDKEKGKGMGLPIHGISIKTVDDSFEAKIDLDGKFVRVNLGKYPEIIYGHLDESLRGQGYYPPPPAR
ncbi:MAG TPA: hypothetical protein VJI52_01225 [Candidatus Nanoarchaeia archaeon]|nr:hypothetical protein [Candidatus Nanoarchaeia archaeon]